MAGEPTDPTHHAASPAVLWTTVNTAEAIPGVSTPLNWTFYRGAIEPGIRGCWVDLGVLPRGEDRIPDDIGRCFAGMFYGRLATNLDQWRYVADRMPGTSGDAVEQQFFGTVRPGVRSVPTRGRYPVVAVKAPFAAWQSVRMLRAQRRGAHDWWTTALQRAARGDARAVLRDAAAMFGAVTRPHLTASMIANGVYEQVLVMCRAAGGPGLELSLMTGIGAVEETQMLIAIWDASRGRLTVDDVLARYGYHGPLEGEISSASWREKPAPLRSLMARYRAMGDDRDPRERERTRTRQQAEAELLRGGSRAAAARIRTILKLAHIYIPLREIGRATFLHACDAARAAARELGKELASSGALADPSDVFYLTSCSARSATTLASSSCSGASATPGITRSRSPVRSPVPVPIPVAGETRRHEACVTGTGVSPGVVEGTARVIVHQDQAEDLADGDVLICHTTDPSWTSLFLVASAVVIDVGSAMSHGAIVARELGIPCVINTGHGSQVIPTGAQIRVDGSAGTVRILRHDRQPAASA